MASRARCFVSLVSILLVLGVVSADGQFTGAENEFGTNGEASVGHWPFSTMPRHEMPALEARLRGHHEARFLVEANVCPKHTTPCANAKGDQTTCCPGRCGANKDPIATCHVAKPRKLAEPGRLPPGSTCPNEAQNACYNPDGSAVICCPGSCGPSAGNSATCAGQQSPTSATSSPTAAIGSPVPSTASQNLPAGSTCSAEAPNACYNPNGSAMVCCPENCGPAIGDSATCAPANNPSLTTGQSNPPVTSTPSPTTAQTDSPVTSTPSPTDSPATTPSPTTAQTDPPVTSSPSPTDSPATTPSPTTAQTNPPVTSTPSPTDSPVTTPSPTTAQTNPPVTSTPSPTSTPVTPNPTIGTISSSGTKLPTPPAGYVWVANPTLTDEFDGNSLDTTKWQPKHPYWAGREPSQFDPANVAVGGGYAKLTSTTKITDVNQVANLMTDPWVSSACIASLGATAGYGYYEARMKASSLNMTSSFWLQSPNYEIDVIETIGSPYNTWRNSRMSMNTHWFENGQDNYKRYTAQLTPVPTYTSGDFHTYSVWFKDAQNLLFYYDGQLVWQMNPPANFNEQMYVFLDTETFPKEGLPTVDTLKDPSKNVFAVDYVRAFTLQPAR